MTAKILDGKQLAAARLQELALKINAAAQQRPPALAVLLVGNDPASEVYVRNKRNACAEIGMLSKSYDLPASITEPELLAIIQDLNQDPNIDGILVQLPLPEHINNAAILAAIEPMKDVDGFHPVNMGNLAQGTPRMRPCTPKGIMLLLEHIKLPLAGINAVIIGTSNIVGKPMLLELIAADSTVTICNRSTKDLASKVKSADLLIVAVGSPNLIPGAWLKPNSVVIDVGINRLPNGTLAGDVDFTAAKEIAGWITPVPGGVGPMTIAALLDNAYIAYLHNINGKQP